MTSSSGTHRSYSVGLGENYERRWSQPTLSREGGGGMVQGKMKKRQSYPKKTIHVREKRRGMVGRPPLFASRTEHILVKNAATKSI